LARDNSKLQLTPAVTLAGSIPWRERAFLQLKAASEIAGVSVTTLYRFSDAGSLKLREFGGRTLVDTPSFIALLDTTKTGRRRTGVKRPGQSAKKSRAPRCKVERRGEPQGSNRALDHQLITLKQEARTCSLSPTRSPHSSSTMPTRWC
jgi:hypothetical protein